MVETEISDEGHTFQEHLGVDTFEDQNNIRRSWLSNRKVDPLHYFDEAGYPVLDGRTGPFLPIWQTSPVLRTSVVNEDIFARSKEATEAKECIECRSALLGGFIIAPPGPSSHRNATTAFFATLRSIWEGSAVEYLGDPMAYLNLPVFDSFNEKNRSVVAVMRSLIHWRSFFRKILPTTIHGITVVLENQCDGFFTYEIHGDEALVVGFGDRHESKYDDLERTATIQLTNLKDGTVTGITFDQDHGCNYIIHIYPTDTFQDDYVTKQPIAITFAVVVAFIFTILMFLVYDRLVERRQKLVLAKATQSTAIVSSLFPKNVTDRLMNSEDNTGKLRMATQNRLRTFLNGTSDGDDQQPIADLFPHCTVFFADIAGFTAWSSTREPSQVFILLQAVYQAFDLLAKRRKVFKVETIGDSYVAVTGLPDPQPNHAVIMVRFAYECLTKVNHITRELEIMLGPGTSQLTMRFGLHSGPVTAGVLRGERARFQLFGDTVNTGKPFLPKSNPKKLLRSFSDSFSSRICLLASRMEHTGERGKIQISSVTADLLMEAGKSHWLKPREDLVQAKGKGLLRTYWMVGLHRSDEKSAASGVRRASTTSDDQSEEEVVNKSSLYSPLGTRNRLVEWMTELLIEHLKKIVS